MSWSMSAVVTAVLGMVVVVLSDASLSTAQQPFPRPSFSAEWLAPPVPVRDLFHRPPLGHAPSPGGVPEGHAGREVPPFVLGYAEDDAVGGHHRHFRMTDDVNRAVRQVNAKRLERLGL